MNNIIVDDSTPIFKHINVKRQYEYSRTSKTMSPKGLAGINKSQTNGQVDQSNAES